MPFDYVTDDIGNHAVLDDLVYQKFTSNKSEKPAVSYGIILMAVISTAGIELFDQSLRDLQGTDKLLKEHSSDSSGDENSNLTNLIDSCWRGGSFKRLRLLKILRPRPIQAVKENWEKRDRTFILQKLVDAYNQPFLGDVAKNFVAHLEDFDFNILYWARTLSVIQSSGMGKSRLLTEAGKYVFTLPICLRHPDSPGFPPSDAAVYRFFEQQTNDNLSLTAHSNIARFLAVAHRTMLSWLQKAQEENDFDGKQLHSWWYGIMEPGSHQSRRESFYSEVLKTAGKVKKGLEGSVESPKISDPQVVGQIESQSADFYMDAKTAVEELMSFLKHVHPGKQPICITYIDEAHELDKRFWVLLRLLRHQPSHIKMWYVFLETKSSVSYFSPPVKDWSSLQHPSAARRFIPPYIALGLDHHAAARPEEVMARIGDLQRLKHLALFGRPLWMALLPEKDEKIVGLAAQMLINFQMPFNVEDQNHIFSVLSQRLRLDPVMASAEAVALADRNVADHMRIFGGMSDDHRNFKTISPSEPILVLGAVKLLYSAKDHEERTNRIAQVLDTLSNTLFRGRLLEKGLPGEIGARILVLLARDFAAPEKDGSLDILTPVPLLKMINTLFGETPWQGNGYKEEFAKAFGSAYVNFTHWVITLDYFPESPDVQLLANLWSRGVILQCCSNRGAIEFLMVVYHGDISAEAVFDPADLSAVFGQVKHRDDDDRVARMFQPIVLPRRNRPIPYLSLLFELENESEYATTGSKVKVTTPNTCDRYSISARGSSAEVYDILRFANVETQFKTLLETTIPMPLYRMI
ncbi:hypothetical protein GALMADRAFT_103308 [Galerina marginata CBS 339.88]|uniref:Uncharacterized protein n=1 Tax=Galerina marginata (strain CBS 339.88) TaxID=685588 RepID=A0A067STS1_GALM3|nr:hypothetical protein GALMADRAFT_103308 [Galerina marginata CBS 339.88]